MANYYYSGQGSLLIAERNAGGVPQGFVKVGNVPELSIDIETQTLEHKESETGQRLTDLLIVTEKKGKFTFKVENLSLDNLALGLWGTAASVAADADVDDEVIVIPAVSGGRFFNLAHMNLSAITAVKHNSGVDVTPYIAGTDYKVNLATGTLEIPVGSALATLGATVYVDYAHLGYTKMDSFMSANAPERWLRFEGINTVDDKRVVIDIFKAQFEPLTGYGLLSDDVGAVDFKGSILADTTRTTGSKFFTQRNQAT